MSPMQVGAGHPGFGPDGSGVEGGHGAASSASATSPVKTTKKKKKTKKRRKKKKKVKAASSVSGAGSATLGSPGGSSPSLPPVTRGRHGPSALSGPAATSVPNLPLGSTAPAALGARKRMGAGALTSASAASPPRRGRTASVASRASSRAGSRGVAGYVPPTSAADVEGETLERARAIVADAASLRKLVADERFCAAAEQVGVAPDELLPRKLESFRGTMGTPRSSLVERRRFHDDNRTLNLAIVMSHQEASQAEAATHAERQRRMRQSAAKDLLARVERERARMEKAVMARERQRQVVERENERLRRVREDYALVLQREDDIQARRAAQIKERRDAMTRRAKEVARTMARVRARREEREEERLDGIRKAEEAKMARSAQLARRHAEDRTKRGLRAKAKDRLIEERREASMSTMEHRKDTMMRHLEERDRAMGAKEEARQREVQRVKDERWVAEARAKANSERLRRQQAARRAAKASLTMIGMEKQEMFEEVSSAIEKERRAIQKGRIIDEDEWKAATPLERSVMPGPGEYEFRRTSDQLTQTGRWRDPPLPEVRKLMETKSWVDQTPGPSHYGLPDDSLTRSSAAGAVKFHDANPKSFLDWAAHNSKQMPAPSDYGRPALTSPQRSFAFSKHNPQGFIEHAAYMARDSPGPGGTVMAVSSPISPKAVMEANARQRPSTTGSAGMRRAMSFTATPAPPAGAAQRSTSRLGRPKTSGALMRAVSSVELRSARGTQLVRRRSQKEMAGEIGLASRMKGLGAAAKYNPSLGTVSKQLEDLVAEVAEESEDDEDDGDAAEELDELDAELIAAADRTGDGEAVVDAALQA